MLGIAEANPPPYYSYKLADAWPFNIPLSLRVYATEDPELSFAGALERGPQGLVWDVDRVRYSDAKENYLAKNISMRVPESVRQANGTWYAHVFVTKQGVWDTEAVSEMEVAESVLHARYEFVKWVQVDLNKNKKNLLGGESNENGKQASVDPAKGEGDDSGDGGDADVTYRFDQVWKPTMPIHLVMGGRPLILGQLPTAAAKKFRVNEEKKLYYPPMHINEFWMIRESLHAMNESVKEVTIEVSFSPIGMLKWTMFRQFDSIWQKQIDFGAMRPDEPDELKRMFLETNPVLLGTTMMVSMAHSVLEVLAFKNDISHWRNIKSMEGVSVRSMIWKIVMEAIVFLYLWDNETSWMITVGNGVGLVIAIWKLRKAVKFENFGKKKLFGFIPWFEMTNRESYSKETKEYDDQAMKYLGYALYPLVLLYALYSLRYDKHKSWYSWVINSLVGAVYAFGFIMMFPQIFINYKLKSVAHMPMKAMMYKTLNTVIDDLFSFIIKMPWLHRLACFRDDIVFLVLLYQRWIYPVDSKRVNEFGQQFEEDGNEKVVSVDGESNSASNTGEIETTKAGDEAEAEEKGSNEKKND
ncbi:unnamed protein product [Chondrus crispus]|uniref:Uncharacterized protein n=1 Tax=Chondrus crispus TaxID=2769 RepID=R7QUV6_CHOCR|nr:unnamed protein product [Chondrus crispus]CDF41135.1 unnamed protein product [Chondrus crispus]|eukprot:XP_005711429.1 unnamed protein product [Chondrus crispus]